jgi:hypothetical protein
MKQVSVIAKIEKKSFSSWVAIYNYTKILKKIFEIFVTLGLNILRFMRLKGF